MVSTIFISSIRVIVPIPSSSRRPPVPIITTASIITPVIIVIVAVIGWVVGVSQKNQGASCRHNDLRESFGNKETHEQNNG
jgi:uncharacterized membrane protein